MNELQSLRAAVRDELDSLWDDLAKARDTAIRGKWSMQCDSLVERIKKLTALVSPTPWRSVDLELVEDGIFQRVHSELGVHTPVDTEAVARARAMINEERDRMIQSAYDRTTRGTEAANPERWSLEFFEGRDLP